MANKCQKGAHMEFKELAAFELLKCHRANKDEIFYPNGNIKYQRSRNGTFCNCYYENGKIAAQLMFTVRTSAMCSSFALSAFYPDGKLQAQITGPQDSRPTWWIKYYHSNGRMQEMVSDRRMIRQWNEAGHTVTCRIWVGNTWVNLVDLCKRSNKDITPDALNRVIDDIIRDLRRKKQIVPFETEYNFEKRKEYMLNNMNKYRLKQK